MTKTRLEAFSDGVLAIIITIMVLELKTPVSESWQDLQHLIVEIGLYAMSFVFVGIYWGNHHHLLHTVKSVTSQIIWANMHLLFWLSLVPFVTRWVGEESFDELTVASYGGLLVLCAIAYFILQQIIMSEKIFSEKLKDALKKQSKKGTISLFAYLISIPLAFVSSLISVAIFVIIGIWWVIPDRNIEKALKEERH